VSGGHWQYMGYRIHDDLFTVSEDGDVAGRWPLICKTAAAFGTWFQAAEHEMDYDISGDTSIREKFGDETFDRAEFAKLLDALLKIAPDEWFPRGKWATIQAVQQRAAPAQEVHDAT